MFFPLTASDFSLWLAVVAVILILTSELLFATPDFAAKIAFDKNMLRTIAFGCGLGFLATVVMHVLGLI